MRHQNARLARCQRRPVTADDAGPQLQRHHGTRAPSAVQRPLHGNRADRAGVGGARPQHAPILLVGDVHGRAVHVEAKYEAVYLHELADGKAARRVIGQWMTFYNKQRPHSALGGRTPAQYYDGTRSASEQAAYTLFCP